MSHVINSRALTGKSRVLTGQFTRCKCTATQLSIWSYRGHRFAAVTICVLSGPRTSKVSGNYVRETAVKRRNKIVQEITWNLANVFSFYAIIAIEHVVFLFFFFNALTFARSLGRCWKPRPSASVFNTSHGTWRMLMHEKPCLIPIVKSLDVNTEHTMYMQIKIPIN